jgi:hypothetical protein
MVPLPRSHFQESGLPVLWSLNLTTKGAHPLVGVAEKLAPNCALVQMLVISVNKRSTPLENFPVVIGIGFCFYMSDDDNTGLRLSPITYNSKQAKKL